MVAISVIIISVILTEDICTLLEIIDIGEPTFSLSGWSIEVSASIEALIYTETTHGCKTETSSYCSWGSGSSNELWNDSRRGFSSNSVDYDIVYSSNNNESRLKVTSSNSNSAVVSLTICCTLLSLIFYYEYYYYIYINHFLSQPNLV